mgnify:CR=1 FL=1
MKIYTIFFFAFFTLSNLGISQIDSSKNESLFQPRFNSVQFEGATLFLFISSVGIAADFDFIRSNNFKHLSIGVRVGYEFCDKMLAIDFQGDKTRTITFNDLNLYSRVTLEYKVIRLDTYFGFNYHMVINHTRAFEEVKKDKKFYPKGGFDFKIKLFKNVFGLFVKANYSGAESFGGLGAFFGYGNDK